jgi:hypothetical protein
MYTVAIDRILAALGLPIETAPEDIAIAVRMCTRRCEELEHKVIMLQEDRLRATPVIEHVRDLEQLKSAPVSRLAYFKIAENPTVNLLNVWFAIMTNQPPREFTEATNEEKAAFYLALCEEINRRIPIQKES